MPGIHHDQHHTLRNHWLAETIRLREAHWGPLSDSQEVRLASTAPTDLGGRILLRARLLAERTGLAKAADRWHHGARLTLLIAALLALLAGAGAAITALGDGLRPVNIMWAAGGLLGLHALTFLLWLASLALRSKQSAGLGQIWLWATRKLARGPDAALAPQALTGLLARQGILRWLLGGVSHGLWLLALLASLVTLLLLLSTRRYGFAWETTILSPETFVSLTHGLGQLPSLLGFAMPDAATIRSSDGLQVQTTAAQTLWSSWLTGLIVVYGIVPRLAGLLICLLKARSACQHLRIDPSLPGHASLRARLMPSTQTLAPDADQPVRAAPRIHAAPTTITGDAVLTAVELPADLSWPPSDLPANIQTTAVLDSREQRHALLDALRLHTPARLLVACDARQTPDRGTLALIVELAALAGATKIWLQASEQSTRTSAWLQRLQDTGLTADAISDDHTLLLHWLAHGEESIHA